MPSRSDTEKGKLKPVGSLRLAAPSLFLYPEEPDELMALDSQEMEVEMVDEVEEEEEGEVVYEEYPEAFPERLPMVLDLEATLGTGQN